MIGKLLGKLGNIFHITKHEHPKKKKKKNKDCSIHHYVRVPIRNSPEGGFREKNRRPACFVPACRLWWGEAGTEVVEVLRLPPIRSPLTGHQTTKVASTARAVATGFHQRATFVKRALHIRTHGADLYDGPVAGRNLHGNGKGLRGVGCARGQQWQSQRPLGANYRQRALTRG